MQLLQNQGLLGIAFFEATAVFILLVLFFLLRRDLTARFLRLWILGWIGLTAAASLQVVFLLTNGHTVRLLERGAHVAAVLLFFIAVLDFNVGGGRRLAQLFPLAAVCFLATLYAESKTLPAVGLMQWQTTILESALLIAAGWVLWRDLGARRAYGARLLAGALWLSGLHGLDQPYWPDNPLFLLRVAFNDLLFVAVGIGMVVLVLETGRARTEELNEKLRRLTLITTASTQSLSVDDLLGEVLSHLVQSLNASHGLVRLIEGAGAAAELVLRSSVGFVPEFRNRYARVSVQEPWAQRVLRQDCSFLSSDQELDPRVRGKMAADGISHMTLVPLPGKDGPLGVLAIGSSNHTPFQPDEVNFLVNVANLLGLTVQNVRLFEQVSTVQRHWAYTFDSIGDPILVHDRSANILRANQRLAHLLGRDVSGLVGRTVREVFPHKAELWKECPYCEGIAGEGDDPDPWLNGYFLASNSSFSDPSGHQLGIVHVLKDITERKRAEEKYRTLIASVQEGVFISTPQGRFVDFNDAFMRITGYESREELLAVDIGSTLYVNPADRDRLKRLLQEHGSVADFEFQIRRKDGEILTVLESSIATRDSTGNVTAYQGFMLDITERKRAEQEIRRRNRELMVLNSIGQTLSQSLDLADSLGRALRLLAELFSLDLSSIYLLDEKTGVLRRAAAVGHRSEYARQFPPTAVQQELLEHVRAVHATVLAAHSLPLPAIFRDMQQKEGERVAHVVVLWSKDRMMGYLSIGSRTLREFSPADLNLLTAVATQIATAIEKSLLYEETRQAYENLRRTQEQLLQSEKMAAVGQLISGVAHELNNPLTAILGYSQLLASNEHVGPQAIEYVEKLYKQAQRTHRIVQNLLSFARQQRPQRLPVRLNHVLEDTLSLREYDLRINNIQLHRELAADLPLTSADPHQLQQVFLNILNNAVDAILEHSDRGGIWVKTAAQDARLLIEFTDSGPGVHDPTRVFDPFYTTKPVGKGTGLGLSICYGIISEHGGAIRVRNAPPLGATFTIELPLYAAEPLPARSRVPSALSLARGGRILLVDDEEAVLDLEKEILHERLNGIRTARSGQEAQDWLEREPFDLVVTDLKMPGEISGLALYEWITLHHPALASRVIFTMSDAIPADKRLQLEARGCRIIQKPFEVQGFLKAIQEGLSQLYPASIQH